MTGAGKTVNPLGRRGGTGIKRRREETESYLILSQKIPIYRATYQPIIFISPLIESISMAPQCHAPGAENRFENGDLVVVRPFDGLDDRDQPSHVNVLYRVVKTFERERTGDREPETMAVVETVLDHAGEPYGDERTFPVEELELAERDPDADPLAAYRVRDHRYANSHVVSGVFTLPPERSDEFCFACGSNAVRWANDPIVGEGGEWCDTCGRERVAP